MHRPPRAEVGRTNQQESAQVGATPPNTEQNSDDPWFHFVYDTRWRIVAVYRVLHWHAEGGWTFDDDPKERFVYHNAGLAGGGGSSYIDAVILRDRDANTAWEDQADGTLEERIYYCQNWRADVVALFGSNGHMLQQVRYDPYGVPFGISKADLTADGVLDSADQSRFTTLYNSGSGTHPFADWNLDGTLSSLDLIAYGNSYTGDVALGYGVLAYGYSRAGGANRKAYAGYEIDPVLTGANGRESVYHVRHRVLLSELGRWNRRSICDRSFTAPHNSYAYSVEVDGQNNGLGRTKGVDCSFWRPVGTESWGDNGHCEDQNDLTQALGAARNMCRTSVREFAETKGFVDQLCPDGFRCSPTEATSYPLPRDWNFLCMGRSGSCVVTFIYTLFAITEYYGHCDPIIPIPPFPL